MSMESRALICPPRLVVAAARHAFQEHARAARAHASIVFDSARDDDSRESSPRVLMITGDTFDLILTIAPSPRGEVVGGAIISDRKVEVEIRRPRRATLALTADDAGELAETTIPAGPARVIVRGPAGETSQSDWFTL